ncbi:LysR family transcriptional regulator [Caldimonas tepidiphila]|uniref:LysR family transcriptional regulator n=1 Tax=Caldimonas tepidiphila TaxID=2315841 RepID=UPI000E5AB1FE|nr:LysR family transcriptional regulator [Caldimonas tepidiphila]
MEIYQLKAFIAVARTGQMTRAAEQLHITQSAVSKQLKALEEELGAPLFERSNLGMTLSAFGRRLMPLAKRTLDAAAELSSAAKEMQGRVSGTLRLGTIIDPKSIRLGELLLEIQRCHPEIDVKLEHGISGSVLERLRDEALDACFFLGSIDDPALKVVQLCLETYVVAAPSAWKDRVMGGSWVDLAALPWIGTPKAGSQTALVDRVMQEQGLVRRTVGEADQESSMIALVRSGVGLCLIRERLAQDMAAERDFVLWDGERIPCPLSLILRAEDAARPLPAALVETVFRVWPSAVYQ